MGWCSCHDRKEQHQYAVGPMKRTDMNGLRGSGQEQAEGGRDIDSVVMRTIANNIRIQSHGT